MESESDPLTRRAVDLFEKEPLKGNSEVHLHTPTKFGEDRSKDLGGDREQTDRQTNRQTDKRCSIYSMILYYTLYIICFFRIHMLSAIYFVATFFANIYKIAVRVELYILETKRLLLYYPVIIHTQCLWWCVKLCILETKRLIV